MKISVEIKDNVFSYDFEVGKETGHGDHALSAHGLNLFVAILDECHKSWLRQSNIEIKEIECAAYIEKHPEVIKKYIELNKGRK